VEPKNVIDWHACLANMGSMKPKGSPGYKSLRKGRISQENARYFVTLCTLKRQPVLCRDSVPEIVFETLQLCSEDFELIASVIMPDHVHVLFA
jgi:hypothetical protein